MKEGCTFPCGQRRALRGLATPSQPLPSALPSVLSGLPLHVPRMARGGCQSSYWEEEGSRERHKGRLPSLWVPLMEQRPRTRLLPSAFRTLRMDHPICQGGCVWAGRSVMPTLCDLMDSSPPGSSVHGILQALENSPRTRKWTGIPFFRNGGCDTSFVVWREATFNNRGFCCKGRGENRQRPGK